MNFFNFFKYLLTLKMEIFLGLLSEQVPNGVMAFTPKGQNVVRFTDIG